MVKIVHEKWKCIGCGACAAICADHWEMAYLKYAFTTDPGIGWSLANQARTLFFCCVVETKAHNNKT